MRSARTVLPAIVIATLLAGAALFRQAAPDRYGLPEIEVLDPGLTGQRIDQDELFGNFYPAAGSVGTYQDAGVLRSETDYCDRLLEKWISAAALILDQSHPERTPCP